LGPSNSVYRIEGEHSLREVDAHTKIERLGSVPVLLPYGMRRHLSARNRADVVLGRSFALVVWLNGHTITGERERETQA
ncbi:intracellular growth attenuator family protein, partial [Enterobacter hormaechei]